MRAAFEGTVTGTGKGGNGQSLEVSAEYPDEYVSCGVTLYSQIALARRDLAKFGYGQHVRVTVEAVEDEP